MLLVCLAFHYNESRITYLKRVVDELTSYDTSVDVIVDTNSIESLNLNFLKAKNISVVVQSDLNHPYYLTACHRNHMIKKIEEYEWFAYMEDDMLLTKDNFFAYKEKFSELWPNYVPGFVRIETYDNEGDRYTPDIMIPITNNMEVSVKGKRYVLMPFHYNYHAFWILSNSALKDSIKDIGENEFLKIPSRAEVREELASFPIWTLNKPCLLSVNDSGELDETCISYHLSNNYSHSSKKIKDIWRISS